MHTREPSTEQPAAANAKRDACRRAEAGDERAFGIGEREQEPGDAADQPRAGLAAQDADDDRSADADEGERAAAKIEMQDPSEGMQALGKSGGGDVASVMSAGTPAPRRRSFTRNPEP